MTKFEKLEDALLLDGWRVERQKEALGGRIKYAYRLVLHDPSRSPKYVRGYTLILEKTAQNSGFPKAKCGVANDYYVLTLGFWDK